jgi:mono/diheme cytochrome c family protein
LKWVARVLGGLVGLIVVALIAVTVITDQRMNTTYAIADDPITIPTDAESVENGARLARVRACAECHGDDMGGKVMVDDAAMGSVTTANLTPGEGGAGQTFKDSDWVRAIRHGVGQDGRALVIMPSYEFNGLTAEDMGDIVAYLKTLPPVDHVEPPIRLGPVLRVMIVLNVIPLISAETIDHSKPMPAALPVGETVEYGKYLTETCVGCHKPDFSGGPLPGDDSGVPAANLTPGGDTAGWTEEDFIKAMREGTRPDGSKLSDMMPWKVLGPAHTDTELKAIWKYLQSLPPVETTEE